MPSNFRQVYVRHVDGMILRSKDSHRSRSQGNNSPAHTEGVDRGGGGTGIEGAESGVEGAESGVEGAGSGSRGDGKRGICGRGSGKIGGRNCFLY